MNLKNSNRSLSELNDGALEEQFQSALAEAGVEVPALA
jgi:hypothetical protein